MSDIVDPIDQMFSRPDLTDAENTKFTYLMLFRFATQEVDDYIQTAGLTGNLGMANCVLKDFELRLHAINKDPGLKDRLLWLKQRMSVAEYVKFSHDNVKVNHDR